MTYNYTIYVSLEANKKVGFQTRHATTFGMVLEKLRLAGIYSDEFNIYMTNKALYLDHEFEDEDQFIDYLIQLMNKCNERYKKLKELKTFLEKNNIEVFDFNSHLIISLYNFCFGLKYDEIAIRTDENGHYIVTMIQDGEYKQTYNTFNAENKLTFNTDIKEGFTKDDILSIIKNIQQSYQKLFEVYEQSIVHLF